jgi:hypothetical protein
VTRMLSPIFADRDVYSDGVLDRDVCNDGHIFWREKLVKVNHLGAEGTCDCESQPSKTFSELSLVFRML